MNLAIVALGAALLSSASIALPSRAAADGRVWRIAFEIDNDVVFAGEDRHYSNGLVLDVLAPQGNVPGWMAKLAYALPPWNDDPGDVRFGFGLRHEMYTPEDSSARAVVPDDRPYAGYLYTRLSLHRDRNRSEARADPRTIPFLDTLELDIGVVGPAAAAEQGQDLLHVATDSPTFRGWDNQLDNEFALVLRRARTWRVPGRPLVLAPGIEADVLANLTGELGNVKTAGTAGMMFRLGRALPADFGRGRFSPPDDGDSPTRVYLFVGVNVSAVARDIFLDGNTFEDSHEVTKRTIVVHAPMGLGFERGRFKSQFMAFFNSKEFDGQDGVDWYARWSIIVDY
ncbi:MAG: lipid A deacylase LpxR family protein [Myxococcota bacterium]|jgi:hypothetical protein|nr:lipid A deacylase LpxR family protein [Myxococcota bacterium]